MTEGLAGRRGTINYSDLHAAFVEHQKYNAEHGTSFEFENKRHAWHGKKCTVLANHGGVVRIDGVQSLYELVPMDNVVLEEMRNPQIHKRPCFKCGIPTDETHSVHGVGHLKCFMES